MSSGFITVQELLEYLRDDSGLTYDEAMNTKIVVANEEFDLLQQKGLHTFEYQGQRVCQITVDNKEHAKD